MDCKCAVIHPKKNMNCRNKHMFQSKSLSDMLEIDDVRMTTSLPIDLNNIVVVRDRQYLKCAINFLLYPVLSEAKTGDFRYVMKLPHLMNRYGVYILYAYH